MSEARSGFLGKEPARAQQPCLHSPRESASLYPLCGCTEIKEMLLRKAGVTWKQGAGWLPTRISSDGQMPVSCVPASPPASRILHRGGWVGLPAVLCYRDRQSWTSLGQIGLLSTFCFRLEMVPFLSLKGEESWGKSPLGPSGIFCGPNFNCLSLNHPPFLCARTGENT